MALLKFSSRSSARHSEAQLRLAPNRPCMTLVMYMYMQNSTLGGSGGMLPQEILTLQPLRLFLLASEHLDGEACQ